MATVTTQPWGFYGRRQELDQLREILRRERWFFLKVSGRRRIGKTSLVQQALEAERRQKVLYLQVPDSDPAGVVSAARDFYALFGVAEPLPTDLRSLAASIGELARSGFVVAVDEFQYFHRKALFEFTSHLQFEVDRLARDAANVRGGLIVLGSIHTEMAALLEDRSAPLFARLTNTLDVPHLDISSVIEILRAHTEPTPERLLFLWNLFEGVPKFYRDAYEEEVLGEERTGLLRDGRGGGVGRGHGARVATVSQQRIARTWAPGQACGVARHAEHRSTGRAAGAGSGGPGAWLAGQGLAGRWPGGVEAWEPGSLG